MSDYCEDYDYDEVDWEDEDFDEWEDEYEESDWEDEDEDCDEYEHA